ncbi:MAG TPA: hypothetical protein P5121_13125, partial [Caldilineaceae bacterium]|nr:hypothetical protein [Caldilineaceae bacterium]
WVRTGLFYSLISRLLIGETCALSEDVMYGSGAQRTLSADELFRLNVMALRSSIQLKLRNVLRNPADISTGAKDDLGKKTTSGRQRTDIDDFLYGNCCPREDKACHCDSSFGSFAPARGNCLSHAALH